MNEEERKERFIALLRELIGDYGGVRIKLADSLNIKPPTLTRWFQGKVDPATIDLAVFLRLAEAANRSIDDLAIYLGIVENLEETVLDNFKNFIRELLSNQSQETLAKKLGVSDGAIAGWISPQRRIDPRRVGISSIAGLAKEKAWTIEKLLIYLGVKDIETENNLLFKLQSGATVLSLKEQIILLDWLSNLIKKKVIREQDIQDIQNINDVNKIVKSKSDLAVRDQAQPRRTICLLLDKEDIEIASRYTADLMITLEINPDNLQVTTIPKLPQSLDNIDVLIFDISSPDSPSIALIKEISFDGDIVVFASENLPENVRAGLEDKVSDVLIKPIDWSSLKDKEYFR